MELQAELVHAEPGRRVVRVSAHQGTRLLGSALGEGEDAERAEDRARDRLLARLEKPVPRREPPMQIPQESPPAAPRLEPTAAEPPFPEPPFPESLPEPLEEPAAPPTTTVPPEPPMDPEDWSQELAQLDLQLQRLGWSREQEGIFLQRAFGHPSRSRLTRWADLTAFLNALEPLTPGQDPATAPIPLLRSDLLGQCDTLLQRLGWDTATARSYLERHLGVSSRQQLSDAQLLQFNMLLEESWLAAEAQVPVCEPGQAPASVASPAPQSSPQRP